MSADLDLEPLFAETKARLAAIRARKKAAAEAAKPKIVATVSEKMAEAIKHDPTSLRLSKVGVLIGGYTPTYPPLLPKPRILGRVSAKTREKSEVVIDGS
jgi:hypothetical protein